MSSICYGGSTRMVPEVEPEDFDPMFDEGYPHKMPTVYLDGWGEVYNRQHCFNWDDDSVVIVRDKRVVKYTRSRFVELLAKNESGDIVWMDGRSAPCSDCWAGEYHNENRGAQEYTIEEYDLENRRLLVMSICFSIAMRTSTTILLPDCWYIEVSETTILKESLKPMRRRHSRGVNLRIRPLCVT